MSTLYWPFPTSTVTEWPASAGRPNHTGTDFGIPQGTPLRATIDGVITRHNNDGLGAYVLDIMSDGGLLVRNGHLSRMDVQTGQRVKAGQIIGLTGGQPGTPGAGQSTGPHLHWELRRDRKWVGGDWVDPRTLKPKPSNFDDKPKPKPEEKKMSQVRGIYFRKGEMRHVALVDTTSGLFQEYRTGSADYNRNVQSVFNTGSFLLVTEMHYEAFKKDMAKVRAGVA
jgi:murein DD-endopeptidase MepM/ murein hydrolase activator NlpD